MCVRLASGTTTAASNTRHEFNATMAKTASFDEMPATEKVTYLGIRWIICGGRGNSTRRGKAGDFGKRPKKIVASVVAEIRSKAQEFAPGSSSRDFSA